MNNQPNDLVTLEWLKPSLDEQFDRLHQVWQYAENNETLGRVAEDYQQIFGVLQVANLGLFARLAVAIRQLVAQIIEGELAWSYAHVGLHASELLQHELNHYALMGIYHKRLLAKRIAYLEWLLDQEDLTEESALLPISVGQEAVEAILRESGGTSPLEPEYEALFNGRLSEQLVLPTLTDPLTVDDETRNRLLTGWRHQVQQILAENKNQPEILSYLYKASQYLYRESSLKPLQAIWYLVGLWLQNLQQNDVPTPKVYAHLLAELDALIVWSDQTNQTTPTEDNVAWLENVLADVYLQLNMLKNLDDSAKALLLQLHEPSQLENAFFPRILTIIEQAIFNLDQPALAIEPLQEVKWQLFRRGWSFYANYVEQILSDLHAAQQSPEALEQLRWQIERQLQDLYGEIYQMQATIHDKIGDDGVSYVQVANLEADEAATASAKSSGTTEAEVSGKALRQVRIAVEAIKHDFNGYLQRHNAQILPNREHFEAIQRIFEEMDLPRAVALMQQLADLFVQLIDHQIDKIDWQLTDAFADSIAMLELFLDRLAQRMLDQDLLDRAEDRLNQAQTLLEDIIQSPELLAERLTQDPESAKDMQVVRYGDEGEVAPSESDLSEAVEPSTNPIQTQQTPSETVSTDPISLQVVETEALQKARSALKDDDFSIDEEIREIFIEEAGEVLEQLGEFLPAWRANPEDLSPLTEIRRGFHTLKGSGRMVGANNLGEMAWAVENMLNRVLDHTLPVSGELVDFIIETKDQIPTLVQDFERLQPPSIDPAITVLKAQNLLANKPINDGLILQAAAVDTDLDQSVETQVVQNQTDSSVDQSNVDQAAADQTSMAMPEVLLPFIAEAEQLPEDAEDADPDIKEIFIEEAREVLESITPLFAKWQQSPEDLSILTDVRRGFHTLKGSGRMVGANRTGELAWAIENMLNRVLDHTIVANAGLMALVEDVLQAYPDMVNVFEAGADNYPSAMTLWVAVAHAYSKKLADAFDYLALRADSGDHTAKVVAVEEVDSTLLPEDDVLKSMTSINEMMAEADVTEVGEPKTVEEKQFIEIFLEEAKEHLATIRAFLQQNEGKTEVEVPDNIVRAFHTLRGASGVKAFVKISEVSTALEHSLESLQQHDSLMNAQHLQAMAKSADLIESRLLAYDAYNQDETHDLQDEAQNQQDIDDLQALLEDENQEPLEQHKLSVASLVSDDIDDLLDGEWEAQKHLESDSEEVALYAEVIVNQIKILLGRVGDSKKFHTLLEPMLAVYQLIAQKPALSKEDRVINAIIGAHVQLTGLFDALAGSMSLRLDAQIINDLNTIIDDNQTPEADILDIEAIETDVELLEIFLEEAQELDGTISQTFAQWKQQPADLEILKALQRYLHTVKGGARMAGIHSIGDLTHEAESVYESFVEGRLTPSAGWLNVMQGIQDTLSLQIEYVLQHQQSFFVKEIIEQLKEFIKQGELPDNASIRLPVISEPTPQEAQILDEETEDHTLSEDENIVDLQQIIKDSWSENPPDPDILNVFLEEAEELVESSTEHLQAFRNNTSDVATLQALQRELHTIKGGSRMVSANGIADLAHQMETVYEDLGSRRRPATRMVSQLLTACHDWLANAVFLLTHNINPPVPTPLIEALEQFSHNPDSLQDVPNVSLQSYIDAIDAYEEYLKSQKTGYDISQMPPMLGDFGQVDEQSVNQNEMIRISADLMERMINLSGESAINRARIDMGISSLTNSIEEMGVTVQRLADQLRRMDIELEAQILAQIDDNELLENEDFDPLEMDQYSSLNQLSKSLAESASDLLDIKTTLLEKTRDSENLLLQLSRTQNELQDGLMNSRIVPFSRLTPRLQRIVRQTANELHKTVELVIINADDEMDRTILERITSPLEHMLRNAVDHGIETAQERASLGKDRVGRITLEITREGSEVVINLTDDGSGINVEAVRNKAIAQGLIDPNDDSLTDIDIMQYIFNAGLTTTKKVTQISGRGVGMDVVRSEIRQLGGNVAVDSIAGKGSRFTMRVPLTVAVSDALVVRAADRYYAIPLVQIERVVRVNPDELFAYHQSDKNTFAIDGIEYRLRYLNEILSGYGFDELTSNANTSLPVIIVKNQMGQHLALQVDEISGSRIEVVVKPLERQLSHVAGISAATIMGDGSVMLILDLMALIRNAPAKVAHTAQPIRSSKRPTILVVDDSVTVRKVTSRFLERQGFDALVAKDGVDAMEMLQELTPDLILLDIEMPRMDGFEVATQVRHNARLRDIPIIMITSRTGEKHRERAMEIGVNDYMGKPFQENNLLSHIQKWLGIEVTEYHDG